MDPVLWLILAGVIIVQLPFAADILSGLFPHFGISRMTQRAVTAILTLCVTMLFFLAMKQFCEMVAPRTDIPSLHYALVIWLWLNTVSNYMGAVFVKSAAAMPRDVQAENSDLGLESSGSENPGTDVSADCNALRPRSQRDAAPQGTEAGNQQADGCHERRDTGACDVPRADECDKCGCLRYPGTHHCRVCESCVPMMDHHCPFTRNCVSKHNYAHFYMFLFYCTAGLVYAAIMTYRDFNICWMHDDFEEAELALRRGGVRIHWTCRQLGSRSLVFLPVLVLALMMMSFLLFHSVLLFFFDSSTIDFFSGWRGLSLRGFREVRAAQARENRFFQPSRRSLLFTWPKWQYLVPFCGQFGFLLCRTATGRSSSAPMKKADGT